MTSVPRSWYWRWWGILLLILAVFVATAVFLFILITARFWRDIRSGQSTGLSQGLFAGFSTGNQADSLRTSVLSATERAILENTSSPYQGNGGAPLTIVEFTDFKCPNCREAAPIIKQILQKYPTKIKYIMRHFPVETTHPGASQLSELVYCAGAQGKYWPVQDWLFAKQDILPDQLDAATQLQIVEANDLDGAVLSACLAAPAARTAVNRDYVDGSRFGVRGTPTFFINGEKVEGVIPFAVWDTFLQGF